MAAACQFLSFDLGRGVSPEVTQGGLFLGGQGNKSPVGGGVDDLAGFRRIGRIRAVTPQGDRSNLVAELLQPVRFVHFSFLNMGSATGATVLDGDLGCSHGDGSKQ